MTKLLIALSLLAGCPSSDECSPTEKRTDGMTCVKRCGFGPCSYQLVQSVPDAKPAGGSAPAGSNTP
jgi:hypothetical protein